jgi:acyl-CoA thioester hydrolase
VSGYNSARSGKQISSTDSVMTTFKNNPFVSVRVSEARARVRYAETDQMGFAYYANYLVWFEVGRSQFCNDCGFSYRDMERETGLFLTVGEAHCRYKTAARYEDELIIRTRIRSLTRRTLRFVYEIERADGVPVASGETLHVLINSDGRPSSFPPDYLAKLRGSAEDLNCEN